MGRSIGKIDKGIPMPIMPTENTGMISGAIRKKGGGRRDERGSFRKRPSIGQRPLRRGENKLGRDIITLPDFKDEQGNPRKPTPQEFESELAKQGIYKTKKSFPKPGVTGTMPPAPTRPPDVGPFPDPTLGGPPEREVPIPKERPIPIEDGQKNFFETMFERADNKRQMRDIEKGERRDRQEAMRDEARMRDSERGGGRKMRDSERGGGRKMRDDDRGGRRMRDDDRGGRNRRRRRRDFTRKRSRMEGRRSREERGAFRDRYVSTLRR